MEDFVTFEQAQILKGLGFDWKCYTFYHWDNWQGLSDSGMYENHNMFEKCVSAPTLSQVQKWLRNVKGIKIFITYGDINEDCYGWEIIHNGQHYADLHHGNFIETYEEALLESIDEAIELLKENGNDR